MIVPQVDHTYIGDSNKVITIKYYLHNRIHLSSIKGSKQKNLIVNYHLENKCIHYATYLL